MNLTSKDLSPTAAAQIALDFLMEDLNVNSGDREWFTILSARFIGESWYVVEIGIEGLPDRWAIQVYDTGEYDPNYTFISPIRAAEGSSDLAELPESIAQALVIERSVS
jgi:hypothetical protein